MRLVHFRHSLSRLCICLYCHFVSCFSIVCLLWAVFRCKMATSFWEAADKKLMVTLPINVLFSVRRRRRRRLGLYIVLRRLVNSQTGSGPSHLCYNSLAEERKKLVRLVWLRAIGDVVVSQHVFTEAKTKLLRRFSLQVQGVFRLPTAVCRISVSYVDHSFNCQYIQHVCTVAEQIVYIHGVTNNLFITPCVAYNYCWSCRWGIDNTSHKAHKYWVSSSSRLWH